MPQLEHEPDSALFLELPTLEEICLRDCATREWLEPELFAVAEPEFLRCVTNAVEYNDNDAWAFERGEADTADRIRSRVAWVELFMFCKECVPALPGG
jgi:hypothetical protein